MMLKNRNLNDEVRAIVNSSGVRNVDIAKSLGISPQGVISIYRRQFLAGDEGWIRVLDACGYDVEVRIKKRKVE